MTQGNVELVARWFEEVWNQRREETIDELLTDSSICYADQGSLRGPEAFKQRQYFPFLAAFPGLRITVHGLIGEGDEVVVRWSAEGVHRGEGLGFAPTGEAVSLNGLTWVKVRDGKMMEAWQHSNIPAVIGHLASLAGA